MKYAKVISQKISNTTSLGLHVNIKSNKTRVVKFIIAISENSDPVQKLTTFFPSSPL